MDFPHSTFSFFDQQQQQHEFSFVSIFFFSWSGGLHIYLPTCFSWSVFPDLRPPLPKKNPPRTNERTNEFPRQRSTIRYTRYFYVRCFFLAYLLRGHTIMFLFFSSLSSFRFIWWTFACKERVEKRDKTFKVRDGDLSKVGRIIFHRFFFSGSCRVICSVLCHDYYYLVLVVVVVVSFKEADSFFSPC
ncbi:hypothetical protein B0T24DRAFT_336175 [Lasiosphaeria ovina]|uniref:Transmembrane protein n=1 Tax=Lasiosphaeria ovina TaxID=92902 RepID=A0AAE0N6Y6_9PEZI|nr:hypothetical protein B0T24DRAFT_336175 [Lasiosphaeria ovina]